MLAFEAAISKITLVEPIISYLSLVMNRYYKPEFIHFAVAGALIAYDLPDLAAYLAPRQLVMINTADHNGNRAGPQLLEKDLAVVKSAFASKGATANLEIRNHEPYDAIADLFKSFVR